MAGIDEPLSVAVLAGGYGTRLGRDKASAPVAGQPLLRWVVDVLAPLGDELLISRRRGQELPALPGVDWVDVPDRRVDAGPLAGIEALLLAARHDLVLTLATDMPLARPELLRFIARSAHGYDAVMPTLDGVDQPLCAAYRRSALPVVQAQLDAGDGRIRLIMPKLHGRRLVERELAAYDPQLETFTNVNRPDDLARVGRILTARRQAAGQED